MKRRSFRDVLKDKPSLVLPSAHDALSARMIENAGFDAVSISGSAMLAARYALPDLGIAGLGDMLGPTRDILRATTLPCLGDGDDGYGDCKSVARTIRENEALGLSAITIEDQSRTQKQPGQGPATGIVDEAEIAAKLRIAAETRDDADFWIMGRTDAYATLGLDGAMKRADLLLRNGADGIFIAGVRKPDDLLAIGERFSGTPMIAVIYGGKDWPSLTIAELSRAGYTHIVYPLALILPVCLAIGDALEHVRSASATGGAPAPVEDVDRARALMAQAVDLATWAAVGAPPGR